MNIFIYIRLFRFYFLKHFIFILMYFYAEDNFRKPISAFQTSDIIRFGIVVCVMYMAWSLTSESFNEFQSISKKIRLFLGLIAAGAALLCGGYLLGIYFEHM